MLLIAGAGCGKKITTDELLDNTFFKDDGRLQTYSDVSFGIVPKDGEEITYQYKYMTDLFKELGDVNYYATQGYEIERFGEETDYLHVFAEDYVEKNGTVIRYYNVNEHEEDTNNLENGEIICTFRDEEWNREDTGCSNIQDTDFYAWTRDYEENLKSIEYSKEKGVYQIVKEGTPKDFPFLSNVNGKFKEIMELYPNSIHIALYGGYSEEGKLQYLNAALTLDPDQMKLDYETAGNPYGFEVDKFVIDDSLNSRFSIIVFPDDNGLGKKSIEELKLVESKF